MKHRIYVVFSSTFDNSDRFFDERIDSVWYLGRQAEERLSNLLDSLREDEDAWIEEHYVS